MFGLIFQNFAKTILEEKATAETVEKEEPKEVEVAKEVAKKEEPKNIIIPKVIAPIVKKEEPKKEVVAKKEEPKEEVVAKKEEPKKVEKRTDGKFPFRVFNIAPANTFSTIKDSEESKDPAILPPNFKAAVLKDKQNVFIHAIDDDMWLSYKTDDKPIKRFVLKRGRKVLLVDHAKKIGEKIRISGGGRCNFTNTNAHPSKFISKNPKFVISALSQYTQNDFINLIKKSDTKEILMRVERCNKIHPLEISINVLPKKMNN